VQLKNIEFFKQNFSYEICARGVSFLTKAEKLPEVWALSPRRLASKQLIEIFTKFLLSNVVVVQIPRLEFVRRCPHNVKGDPESIACPQQLLSEDLRSVPYVLTVGELSHILKVVRGYFSPLFLHRGEQSPLGVSHHGCHIWGTKGYEMAFLTDGVLGTTRRPNKDEGEAGRQREVIVSFGIVALLTCAVGVAAFTLPTKPTDISIERAKLNAPLAGPRAPM
jgi:hypothetical protein